MSDFIADTMEKVEAMIDRAERNGWNAALNAARTILPVEYSQRLRALYKSYEDDPSGAADASHVRGEK